MLTIIVFVIEICIEWNKRIFSFKNQCVSGWQINIIRWRQRDRVSLGSSKDRPIRLTQCCTQFKSPGVKILCVLYLHYNVAFSFKCMEIPETKSFIPKGFELSTTLSWPNRSIARVSADRSKDVEWPHICFTLRMCAKISRWRKSKIQFVRWVHP